METKRYGIGQQAGQSIRERDRGIEAVLDDLSAEVQEALNSAANLADKLKNECEGGDAKTEPPQPSDVFSRLERMLNSVRILNKQLGRSHRAVNG